MTISTPAIQTGGRSGSRRRVVELSAVDRLHIGYRPPTHRRRVVRSTRSRAPKSSKPSLQACPADPIMLHLLPKGGATATAAAAARTVICGHARIRLLMAAPSSMGPTRHSTALAKAAALRALSTTQGGVGSGAEMSKCWGYKKTRLHRSPPQQKSDNTLPTPPQPTHHTPKRRHPPPGGTAAGAPLHRHRRVRPRLPQGRALRGHDGGRAARDVSGGAPRGGDA